MKTDVLFINPGNRTGVYQNLAKEFTAIAPPVWILLLADFIRKQGYRPAIYDVNVEGWGENTAKLLLEKYAPQLIVIMVYGHHPSASTQTMPAAGRIAKDMKLCNKDVPVAMGGNHPSALPERTLVEESVDYVIQGEGAYTVEGLLQYIGGGNDLSEVKGLWHKKGNKPVLTMQAPLIDNLDEMLDGYAWDLLPDLTHYRAHNWHCFQYFEESKTDDFSDVRTPYAALNTSLGCPYNCSYCCINGLFGKPGIRYWPLDKVISWIDMLVNRYNVKSIRLDDELFILSNKRVEKFCDRLIERNYNLNIFAYGRVDTINSGLLPKLKKAGVNWLSLGIESASERVREDVNKLLRNDIKRVVREIQENSIHVLGNFMFGLPEDNMESMQETLRLALELKCEFVNFYTVMAYPGSDLYRRYSKKAEVLPDSWQGYSQHSYETKPLPTKYLSSRDVLKFRDEAYMRYFTDAGYLKYVKERFGGRVVRHINKMTEIKLKRKLLELT